MNCLAPKRAPVLRLPKLAAMTLVFWGLSTSTQLDAAPAWGLPATDLQPQLISQDKPIPGMALPDTNPIRVLSVKDAGLYRAAFAAQERSDWNAADDALAQIKDKRLVGHVLADRYMRRPATLGETQQWMASYADLPEAEGLYDQAKHLKGFTTTAIPHPTVGASWAGNNNGRNATAGFRNQIEIALPQKSRIEVKINNALRHGDPLKAREILTTELQRGTLSVGDANDIVSHIAAAFFYEGEVERARPMAHAAAEAGVPLGLWIDGLTSWKQQDFIGATRSFASLAQAPGLSSWDRAAASYWAYRAAKKTGDESQSKHWLTEAAKYPRTFYGYMAANVGGRRAEQRMWKMPELSAKNIDILSQSQAGWQALALVQIGHSDLAESELHRLNPTGHKELQTAVLALAEKAQMPSLSMQLAGIATNDNGQPYDGALYPVPPWQPAGGFKVDRALIYALMRHESQFDPEAISDRGACGLMQIMPSTARGISNDKSNGRDCPDRLFDPATNMEMGQKYVRVLAGQPLIGNNLLLLLTAYNGGPGNLARWMDSDGRADPLLFIETLPVRETRDYVQQVMMQYWMYRSRMNQPDTAVTQLAHGEWPRYALRDDKMRQAEVSNLEEVASLYPVHTNGSR